MPSRVSYGSSRLIPAPFVSLNKTYQTTGDGQNIGSVWQINVNGTIVTDKGSPNSSGEFHTSSGYPADEVIGDTARLGANLRKIEAITDLFSSPGLSFEIQSSDGTAPLKCNPRLTTPIDFQEDLWYNVVRYSIQLEADQLYINDVPTADSFDQSISAGNENWAFEINEERFGDPAYPSTYRLTHSVSATGKRKYNAGVLVAEAWQEASGWVVGRLGVDNTFITQHYTANLPSYYQAYNHVRSSSVDELDGTFSITETWVISSGSASENFDINITTSQSEPLTNVSINGTITGFDQKDSNMALVSGRMAHAENKWLEVQDVIHARAESYYGGGLNPITTSTTVGKNPIAGTINYNYTYDNRPSNLITNSKSESISVQNNFDTDVFAAIPVLGRAAGPVLQSINTKKERTRSLSLEVVFDASVAGSGSVTQRFTTNHPQNLPTQSAEIQAIVDAVKPSNTYQIFVNDQQDSWDGVGRYSLNINWVYEV